MYLFYGVPFKNHALVFVYNTMRYYHEVLPLPRVNIVIRYRGVCVTSDFVPLTLFNSRGKLFIN